MHRVPHALAFAACICALGHASAYAQGVHSPEGAAGAEVQRLQQRRLEATKDLNPRPLVLSPPDERLPTIDIARLPIDDPCFPIKEVVLEDNAFDWLARVLQTVVGQCVGQSALKSIQKASNNALIGRGYITSRVLVPMQSLRTGRLTLRVVPGRISDARTDKPSIGWLRAALPASPGALLNQRDIDQGLENLRRLPSQASATFDIAPGTTVGDSELVLHPGAGKRWHAMFGADNGGLHSTGKTTLSGSLTYDSPLHLYDQLQVAGATNANFGAPGEGNQSVLANYSVPLGYTMFALSASRSRYKQSVPAFEGPVLYSGVQSQLQADVTAVVFRDANVRTETRVALFRQINRNTYDGVDLPAQTRDVIGYELSAFHRQYMGGIEANGGIAWRSSLPGWSKVRGMVLDEPSFNGKTEIVHANVGALFPFDMGGRRFSYRIDWAQQIARTPVMPADYFTIGTRYSVRGFNQQATLAAENGWRISNELNWYLPTAIGTQAIYGGVDAGRVRGRAADFLTGQTLIGAVWGMRGQVVANGARSATMNYDISLGWPLSRPQGIGSSPTFLFQVSSLF